MLSSSRSGPGPQQYCNNTPEHCGNACTTGPMVTRYTCGLSQHTVVKLSWGKKSKKKPSVLTNFRFLVNFIRHTAPMVTMVNTSATGPMVTRCTGSISQLTVVKMSWGKILEKTKCSDQFLFSGQFHQTHWCHGHHGHPRSPGAQAAYLSLQWSTWKKNERQQLKTLVFKLSLLKPMNANGYFSIFKQTLVSMLSVRYKQMCIFQQTNLIQYYSITYIIILVQFQIPNADNSEGEVMSNFSTIYHS